MFQQFLHTVFKPDKKKVSDILCDIELFYKYVRQNEQVFDVWYFHNVFTIKYWECLNNYSWLDRAMQDFLHRGILSMLLFMGYINLEGKGRLIEDNLNEINRSLRHFNSCDAKSKKLHHIVKNVIDLVERKKADDFNKETNKEIYKSITWTLKNIILTNEISIKE